MMGDYDFYLQTEPELRGDSPMIRVKSLAKTPPCDPDLSRFRVSLVRLLGVASRKLRTQNSNHWLTTFQGTLEVATSFSIAHGYPCLLERLT